MKDDNDMSRGAYLDDDQIRAVVRATLDAETERREKTLDDVVLKAVATILTSFGMDEEDRAELKADFIHLRKWRKSVEQAQSATFKAVITVIVAGVAGALWLGFKTVLGK
jgi:hypothetical protein